MGGGSRWSLVCACLFWPLIIGGCMKHTVDVGGEKVRFQAPKVSVPSLAFDAKQYEVWQRFRGAEIDPRVRQVPRDVQEGIKTDPDRYLPELVAFLVDGAEDDFHAVKRLHDWVVDNVAYDLDRAVTGTITSESVGLANVLKSGLSVCAGYANVFEALLVSAGFEVETVSGYARGAGFNAFAEEDITVANHAWNAVTIDGLDYLVDTTWNAGRSMKGRNEWKASYTTEYLFLPPAAFLYTHFPTDPEWQLLDVLVPDEALVALPKLRGRFFTSGVEVLTPLERITEVGSTTRISLSVPEGKAVLAELQSVDGKPFKQATKLVEHPEGTDLLVIFPDSGAWSLLLWVGSKTKTPGYQSHVYSLAGEFGFNASEGSPIRFTDGSG